MSATGMSAPVFATAATGADVTRPLTFEGESLSLAKLDVQSRSQLVNMSMYDVEEIYNVSVVFLRRNGESDFHPAGRRLLEVDDTIAIFGGQKQIGRLVNDNL